MSDPPAPNGAHGGTVVTVRLGEAEFAIPVGQVREVLRPPPLARIPLAPPAVRGLVAVRGELIPVLDLGVRLGAAAAHLPGRLVVAAVRETDAPVALLVDAVGGMVEIEAPAVSAPPPEVEASLPAGCAEGVFAPSPGRLVTLLDLAAVLRLDERGAEPTLTEETG